MLTVDSKSVFSPKPRNINAPTKSQTLGDCCDLESKSNKVEQVFSREPFTTLFNHVFEEIISLRSYVNEQLENVKKSQHDSNQSAYCNHSTRTDELSTYVKRIDLKQKLLNCFQETFLQGAMK